MTTEMTEEELDQARAVDQQILGDMRAAGVSTEEDAWVDYFAFEEKFVVNIDKKQWVQHQLLNEGARRLYMNKQNREVTLEKRTGDAKLKVESGEERLQLLKQAITGWNLVRRNARTGEIEPIPCDAKNIQTFLDKANPKIIDIIDKDVRKHNSWLRQDWTIEDIEKQITELEEMLDDKKKEEAEKNG